MIMIIENGSRHNVVIRSYQRLVVFANIRMAMNHAFEFVYPISLSLIGVIHFSPIAPLSLMHMFSNQVQKQYPNAIACDITDHSDGCGAKLELTVVSPTFENVALLKRHREIQNNLKEQGLFEEIHALQINAWTEEQWEKKKSQKGGD